MWNDNETNSDFIDYQHFVTAITNLIATDDLLPCSIGVYGDWGSGKSSLMKMVADAFEGQEDILVVRFNGWLFEGYEDAKTVLMGRIVDEILDKRSLTTKAIEVGARLLKKIDYLKAGGNLLKYGLSFAAMGPAGLAAASLTDIVTKNKDIDYEKYIKDNKDKSGSKWHNVRSNIQDFHENFTELIEETSLKKMVILIDDLDRCSHDTVIGTLEAIKLFLFTRKTAFIIGADERLIKHAVRRRFPDIPGDNTEVGRDYLEKLIQFPVRIPPMNTSELMTYVNLLFTQLHTDIGEFELIREQIIEDKRQKGFQFLFDFRNAGDYINEVKTELSEALQLCSQIGPVLSVSLNGNPRQCKRFLNMLLLRVNMASSKGISLKVRVLAKLMLLEYFKSETFKSFYELQAGNDGVVQILTDLEKQAKDSASGNTQTIDTTQLPLEAVAYTEDKWLQNWFAMEPALADIDLSTYYYFSRDKLSAAASSVQRMSPLAQEVFQQLFSESKAVRKNQLDKAGQLNQADASAIFEAICEKVNQEENHAGELSALNLLFEFSRSRPDALSQLITFLNKLPERNLPVKIIPQVESTFKQTALQGSMKLLFEKWAENTTNKNLAKMTKTKLNQLT